LYARMAKIKQSFGIVLVKKLPGEPAQFLLVKNRVSNEFSEIIRNPKITPTVNILSRTTFHEKQLLASRNAKLVSEHLCIPRSKDERWAFYVREAYERNYKALIKREGFFDMLASSMSAPIPWTIPRGRVESKEAGRDCATRELEEETGVTRDQFTLDTSFVLHHSVTDYDVTYKMTYYLGIVCKDITPRLVVNSEHQREEVSELEFMTLDKARHCAPEIFTMLKTTRNYFSRTYKYL
jgi:ADP-ribose pyrophosphatase YjhB (NUDIX family)